MAPHLAPGARILSAAKGIEEDRLARMSEILAEVLPPAFRRRVAVLSGPTFAQEVGHGRPTAAVLASADAELARALQAALATPTFRLYTQRDVTGVELGGALKNVMAIAAGIADGLELGLNARAALLTRGLAEITRLGVALGAQPRTFAGLAGLGDLILTCTGELSRNRRLGLALAQGQSLAEWQAGTRSVAEGVRTAQAAFGPRPTRRRRRADHRRGRGRALRAEGAARGAARAPARGPPGPRRSPTTSRGPAMPELRKDPVVERWVIIATERARRPMDFAPEVVPPRGPEGCPFCPGHEERTPPELFRSGRVGGRPVDGAGRPEQVPGPPDGRRGPRGGRGDLRPDRRRGRARGRHREPGPLRRAWGRSPSAHVGEILDAYRERLHALRKDPRLEYVLIFKNHGVAAGASLEHPHSQLIATPILPELVVEELEGAARYFRMKERCVWCDVVRQERRDGSRLVLEEEGFVAVAPFAPRFPFETWVLPTTHRASFESLETDEVDALARLLRELIARLGRALRRPALQLRAPHGAAQGYRPGALPLAPRAHAEAHAGRRVRAGDRLLHQPDAARGRRALPASGRAAAGATPG